MQHAHMSVMKGSASTLHLQFKHGNLTYMLPNHMFLRHKFGSTLLRWARGKGKDTRVPPQR